MEATVDVIVVTYRSAAQIGPCLGAVQACPGVARVVVVDNASGDGSAGIARRAGAGEVLENERNEGFARAVNRGVARCDAEFVLLLNPDTRLGAGALEALLAALRADPGAVFAGPVLREPGGEAVLGARRFSSAANRLLWHLPLHGAPAWATPEFRAPAGAESALGAVPVDYLWGAALLCRREFLERIGGLDERFFLYSEDEDLGRQARALGRRSLLVPAAQVEHVGGASTPDAALAQARVEAANARLLEKWEGPRSAAVFRAGIGPVLALRAAALAAAGRRDEATLAWRTGRLLGRAGLRAS